MIADNLSIKAPHLLWTRTCIAYGLGSSQDWRWQPGPSVCPIDFDGLMDARMEAHPDPKTTESELPKR